jgi:phospholipid/cholesterol/gamma-HCH transport system substrate-binding protein
MARKRRSARFISGVIGAIVVVLSIILSLFALNSSAGLPGVPRTNVTMKFQDTGDIHVDSDLREADFRVGRINAVEYTGDGLGTIQAQFDDTRPVFNNATAEIVSRSGLGQKYLNINRGTPDAGQMPNGGTIPVERTKSTAEILELSRIFDAKTVPAAQSSIEQLGAGLAGNGDALSQAVDSVPTTAPTVGNVVRALNQNNGRDINLLLTSLRNITSRFEGRQQQLTDLNRQLAITLDAVNADGGQALANLVKTAPPAFRAVRQALNDINEPLEITRDAVRDIRPGARDLARATPDVRGVLREAPEPLRKIPGVADVGRPALQALTPALRDLRPVIPPLRFAFQNLAQPLKCLGIYDVGQLLTRFAIPLRSGDQNGNSVRFTLVPNSRALQTGNPIVDAVFGPAIQGLAPETAIERPCPPATRNGATDNVQPPPAPGYNGPTDQRITQLFSGSTPANPAAATTGGN